MNEIIYKHIEDLDKLIEKANRQNNGYPYESYALLMQAKSTALLALSNLHSEMK